MTTDTAHELAMDEAGHWEACHDCHRESLELEPGCADCDAERDELYFRLFGTPR